MRTILVVAWVAVCWLAGLGLVSIAQDSGTSLELGETSPDGITTPVPAAITPAQIGAAEGTLHDLQHGYLVQRGWFKSAADPGGQGLWKPGGHWLWRKQFDGREYALSTDEALNTEYELQAREEEAALQEQAGE